MPKQWQKLIELAFLTKEEKTNTVFLETVDVFVGGQIQAPKLFFSWRAKSFLHHPVCYFCGNCNSLSMRVYNVVRNSEKSYQSQL